jgi:hypothetical protein
MSDGWAILVITKVRGSADSRQIYYARFEDRVEAEQAVRRRVGATSELMLDAQTRIEGCVFDEMKVKPGTVTQW